LSDEYILDDVIETDSDEDTLLSDIRNNPVKWLLSMAILTPGIVSSISKESNNTTLTLPESLDLILAFFVIGQLFMAPLFCYFLARTGNVPLSVFTGFGGSAILLINPTLLSGFFLAIGWFFAILCVALTVPMLIVLKSKKKLLDPGKERLVSSTLLSTAILMFTIAVIVPSMAFGGVSCEDDSGNLQNEFIPGGTCSASFYAPILGMVGVIGWAWPKGKKIIDDLSDDFLDGLKD